MTEQANSANPSVYLAGLQLPERSSVEAGNSQTRMATPQRSNKVIPTSSWYLAWPQGNNGA